MTSFVGENRPNLRVLQRSLKTLDLFDSQLIVSLYDRIKDCVLGVVKLGGSVRIQRLPTPDTDRLVAGRLLVTPRTDPRRTRRRLPLFNVDTFQTRELAFAFLGKNRDISGGGVTAPNPPKPVFEVGLRHPPRSEVRRTALTEVRRRHRFVEPIDTTSEAFKNILKTPVAHLFGDIKFTPKRRVGVVAVGMTIKPLPEVRDRRDKRDSSAAGFSINTNLQAVVMVRYVADRQPTELTRTTSRVPHNSDESGVTRLCRGVGKSVHLLAGYHIRGVRRRVVVRGRPGVNPATRVGYVVPVGDTPGELAQGGSVVLVRLFAVAFGTVPMYPLDAVFSGFAGRDGVGDADGFATFTRENITVTQQFRMSVKTDIATDEAESSVEVEENVAVAFADYIAPFDGFSEVFTQVLGVVVHTCKRTAGGLSVRFKSHPGLVNKRSNPAVDCSVSSGGASA